MDDALLVRLLQCVGNLQRDRDGFLDRDGTSRHLFAERRSFDQFHHQVVGSDVVEMADVRMIQRGDGAGFAFETFAEAFARNFDRDLAAQTRVAGAVHLAHPPLADARQDFVGAEFASDSRQHRVDCR